MTKIMVRMGKKNQLHILLESAAGLCFDCDDGWVLKQVGAQFRFRPTSTATAHSVRTWPELFWPTPPFGTLFKQGEPVFAACFLSSRVQSPNHIYAAMLRTYIIHPVTMRFISFPVVVTGLGRCVTVDD